MKIIYERVKDCWVLRGGLEVLHKPWWTGCLWEQPNAGVVDSFPCATETQNLCQQYLVDQYVIRMYILKFEMPRPGLQLPRDQCHPISDQHSQPNVTHNNNILMLKVSSPSQTMSW